MVRHGREDIEDAAAQGELAASRDHVDTVVGELDESRRHLGEVESAGADREIDGRDVCEAGREGLQRAAHR